MTTPFFVAFAYIALFPSKYPAETVTPNAPVRSKVFVSIPAVSKVETTSTVNVSERVATFASAVTTAFVPALLKVMGSFT